MTGVCDPPKVRKKFDAMLSAATIMSTVPREDARMDASCDAMCRELTPVTSFEMPAVADVRGLSLLMCVRAFLSDVASLFCSLRCFAESDLTLIKVTRTASTT